MTTHLCERCCAPIDWSRDRYVATAHPDHAGADGTVRWVYSSVHVDPCGEPATARSAAEPPHTGAWNSTRRGCSPAAVAWAARGRERQPVK